MTLALGDPHRFHPWVFSRRVSGWSADAKYTRGFVSPTGGRLKYRGLGKTDLEVSEVGFGVWTVSTGWWGKLEERESITLLSQALDLGINFFDTSDVYGQGHSEDLLGVALRGKREQVYLSTKFNLRKLDGQTPRERIFGRCEESLRKLGTDHIDLFQVHYNLQIPY